MAVNPWWGNPKVFVIVVVVSELFIGWVPWFIASMRKAEHRHWIGLAGVVTAPTGVAWLAALAWSLLAKSQVAEGRGFPVRQVAGDEREVADGR